MNHFRESVVCLLGSIVICGMTVRAADAPPAAANDLIKQGTDAFDAGTFDKARDAFADACKADPKNLVAQRDFGIACLRVNQASKATHPLELAMASKTLDRGLVLARADERIAAKSPMQAAKCILTFFDAHPAPVDEDMLDGLGIALSQAEASGIKSQLVTDAGKSYKKLNAKLESTRPGEKHWGMDWLPTADQEKKQSAVTEAQTTIKTNSNLVRTLNDQIAATQRKKDAVLYTEGDNNKTHQKDAYQKQIDEMAARVTEAQTAINDAQKAYDENKPKWPENIPVEKILLDTDAKP